MFLWPETTVAMQTCFYLLAGWKARCRCLLDVSVRALCLLCSQCDKSYKEGAGFQTFSVLSLAFDDQLFPTIVR